MLKLVVSAPVSFSTETCQFVSTNEAPTKAKSAHYLSELMRELNESKKLAFGRCMLM